MILLTLPTILLLTAAIFATVKAKGDWKRWLKIFFLALLGLLVVSAGICVLILMNLDLKNMH